MRFDGIERWKGGLKFVMEFLRELSSCMMIQGKTQNMKVKRGRSFHKRAK